MRARALPALTARVVAVVAAATLTLTACSGEETATDDSGSAGSDSSETTESSQTPAEASAASCDYPTDAAPAAKEVEPPAAEASASGEVAATISTSAGDLAVTLDATAAPCTVNSFLSLAEQGYFDDTSCHRLTTQGIYVLQCGDPSGSGMGGPGYSYADELTGEETYGPGTLAMANAGPDTNGSQFFVVYGDSPLDPNYTVFGHLDEASVKVVTAIADKGTADGGGDGAPKKKVTINGVTQG